MINNAKKNTKWKKRFSEHSKEDRKRGIREKNSELTNTKQTAV